MPLSHSYFVSVDTNFAKSKFSNPDHFFISSFKASNDDFLSPKYIKAAFFAPSSDNFFVKYLVSTPYKQGISL